MIVTNLVWRRAKMINIFKFLKNFSINLSGFEQIRESTEYSFKHDFSKKGSSIEEFQYRTGFIFYMDILGCRGLSLNSSKDDASLNKVKKIVGIFTEIEKQYEDEHWGKNYTMPFTHDGYTMDRELGEVNIEVTMSLFSDSIIISYFPEAADRFVIWYEQMHQIFNDICRTVYIFARNGIFLRGGMSYGKLYHCGSVCYGPALLDAVRLEKEICYPTIAISDSFRERIYKDLRSKEIDDFAPGYKLPHELKTFAADFYSIFIDGTIVKDQTKMMLDWLMAVFYNHPSAIDEIRKAIIEQLENDYPQDVKEKYTWLAKRFNHSLSLMKGLGLGDYSHAEIQLKGGVMA